MRRDEVVDLITRYVLVPGEQIQRRRDDTGLVEVVTNLRRYRARPATWAIARADGVDSAVRVYAEGDLPNSDLTFGFLWLGDGRVCFLNAVADLAALGAVAPEPLAYAEILAELYTHPDITGPVVYPLSASWTEQSGFLLRDPVSFVAAHPGVDPAAVAAPLVGRAGDAVDLRFCAYTYLLLEFGTAVSVFGWWVRMTPGVPATWERTTVVDRLPLPAGQPKRPIDG